MEIIVGLMIIVGIYMWVLAMDRFFKSCSHYGYIQFLKGTGLEIKCFHITWTTTAFNKVLISWGKQHERLQNVWFTLGLFASLILIPISTYILLLSFVRNFWSSTNEETIVQPIVPGINLPASEIGYYSATLLISSVLHELGHALASVHEDVNIINVGANIFFILPVAYVNLNADKLFSLNPWKRLKILCAGVWHNLLIAFVAYLSYISLSLVFSPLFDYGNGIIVTNIDSKSPLLGSRGLNVADKIVGINDCTVYDENSWYYCLSVLHTKKPAFCIEADKVLDLDESVHVKHFDNGLVTCCHSENTGKLCFEYLDGKDNILEFPPYACLPGRTVIEVSKNYCTTAPHSCPKDTHCVRPFLVNHTNLFSIKREKQGNVIFIGPVGDLVKTIKVSLYQPKYKFVGSAFPDVVVKFLEYLVMFSMGLAIVNVLPCLFMDGQYITDTLFHLVLSSHLRTTHIKRLSAIVTAFFTFLITIHCIVVLLKKTNWYS